MKKKANSPLDKEAVLIIGAVGAVLSFLTNLWTTKQWDESLAGAAVAGVVFLIARWKVYSKHTVQKITQQDVAAEDFPEQI